MPEDNKIQLFEGQQVRYVWDSENPRRYWSDLKRKLEAEGSEMYEKIVQLKMPAPDGRPQHRIVGDSFEKIINSDSKHVSFDLSRSSVDEVTICDHMHTRQ